MSSFAESSVSVQFPSRYRDARDGLRVRVVDASEEEVPDFLVTSEIGEKLLAAITYGPVAVPPQTMKTWGVSIDEAMATALANISALPVERETGAVDGAQVTLTVGHRWVSSLLIEEGRRSTNTEGFLAAVPSGGVMATTPVTGIETVEGLEMLMGLCDELFESVSGISPFVWWWYQGNYWRVTDRVEDGSIDIHTPSNVCAYHLVAAIQHLANPCEECGRP